MADTKIRTDRLNVATIVKSILDQTTAAGIVSLLSAADATNTLTFTNKTINPPSVGTICNQAGVTYGIGSAYDHVQLDVGANVGFKMSSTVPRFTNQLIRIIFLPYGGDHTITWDSSIVAASGITLPTTFYSNKIINLTVVAMRYTAPNYYWLATHIAIEP